MPDVVSMNIGKDVMAMKAQESSATGGKVGPISADEKASEIRIPRKLLTRIDLHVIPVLTVVYTLSFLDRVSISSALLFKLPQDLHLTGNQPNTAIAVIFVTYVLFEIPGTFLMKRIGPRRFLPACALIFGILMLLQGFVQSFGGLVTLRLLMGLAESPLLPSCFYIISMWYPKAQAQRRFTFFFCGATFATAFGGLLSSACAKMDGIQGLSAWRWIFIMEGLLTCILALFTTFFVSDFPELARWLDTEDRTNIIAALEADQGASQIEKRLSLRDVLQIFQNWQIALSAPVYFALSVSAYGLAFFLPSIVKSYGYSPIEAQLHAVIPWACALVVAVLFAYISDRLNLRSPFIVGGLLVSISGNIMLSTIHNRKHAEFAGVTLYVVGLISILPIFICWVTMNLQGHRQRAVCLPYLIGLGNTAGIVGVYAFPAKDAPRYVLGYGLGLGFLVAGLALILGYAIGYKIANQARDKEDQFTL